MRINTTAKAAALAVFVATPAIAEGAGIALPSGREVSLHDVIWGAQGPAGLAVRFRFLETDLGAVLEAIAYDALEADMAYLCESYALDRIANTGPQPSTIIISISDRPVAFGEPNPEAVQIFEAYSRDGDRCIWEGF